MADDEALLLDQRLYREGGLRDFGQADLDLVGMRQADLDAALQLFEMCFQNEPHRLALPALSGPQHRFDPALFGNGAREHPVGRGSDQTQGPVEVGFADAVGAHVHSAGLNRQVKASDGAVSVDRDGGERQGEPRTLTLERARAAKG
jgi:hypothetical protein